MLLTDGNPNKTEDLRVHESGILGLAHKEVIDLEVKLSLATEEISQEIIDFLLGRSSGGDVTTRRSIGVSDVVVTRQMKRWHALHTLQIVYQDAFRSQLNDRYKGLYQEYRQLARTARDQTIQYGIGLVFRPIPVAPQPTFDFVAAADPATLYYARIAWVGVDGSEGFPSEMTTFMTPTGSLLVVDAGSAPNGVVGFHVYLGVTPDELSRQNASPVAVGSTFTLPSADLLAGAAPGDGQAPDFYQTGGPLIRRG